VGILDRWRFCPLCSGPLRHEEGRAECERCGEPVYANPIPGSQAVIEREGRVLLGRRALDPSAGLWDLPGGFVDEYEHPEAALHREVLEETGLEVDATEWLGMWMQAYDGRNVLCLTWLATPTGGEERAADDLVELRWFGADELPGADELAFESYVEILSLWRARQQHA
jgi:ADP-ribose pyrophosphatase YjhB (NUDIX family)